MPDTLEKTEPRADDENHNASEASGTSSAANNAKAENAEMVQSAARIELPSFIEGNIKLWLTLVEHKFSLHRITSEQTKYSHLACSLPAEVAVRVADFLVKPPSRRPYMELRELLEREYEDSTNARITKLLDECELGDQKPTMLLRRMRSLAKNEVTDSFLLTRFLRALPEQIRTVIAATGAKDLDKVAVAADTAMEFSHMRGVAVLDTSTVNVTVGAAPTTVGETTIRDILSRFDALELKMSQLSEVHARGLSRTRPRSPHPRNRSKSREYDTCWYHFKFGADAKKCRQGCKMWNSGPNTAGNESARQ